ncbi:DUF3289 family protein [Erwinia aphidicola]|nr:DUF3289 family protein [Erwinia aphidicola]
MANVTAWGQYSPLIKGMIARFKSNEGGVFRSKLLDKAFIEHKTTKNCVADINGYVSNMISNSHNTELSIDDLLTIKDLISENVKLPKFDDYDLTNGLGITIHDTYSTSIYIDYIDVSKGEYKAQLTFKIQDHFGLDVGDVNGKWFEYFTWFVRPCK